MSSLLRKKFDASKCKTLLQVTSERLKVLRNKEALAVRKSRVDVAKLLEKGQDSSAKMQVETVFREEKILLLYDLLYQFCQLVINGLESVKSQKDCPLDLREAVASLIFAASKCAELEELKRVSKQLASKYGTDFSVAAKELRPDCGVNKQIIQCLSARPLDFDAKLKLLKEIAVQNNINWDDEMTVADAQSGATDLIDGPIHFASASELSQVGGHILADQQKSRPMHVNEVKVQGNAVLRDAIDSRAMPAADSLGSPHHDAHQFAKINTNTGYMDSSMVSEQVMHTPALDPYALARAEGKMDYKVVSDYMKRAQSMQLKQESRGGVAYERTATQLPEREQGHNVSLDASHREDYLQRSKGKKAKKRRDMMDARRRNEEEQLLDLQNAAEYAFASATHAAEAAKAAVHMVRMESFERSKGSKAVNINKLQEMQSESSSGSIRDDKVSGMDFGHSPDRQRHFNEDEVEMEPSQQNGMDNDQVSEPNKGFTLDTHEDSFKYVVYEQTSGLQKDTHNSTQAEGYNENSESYAFPEVWSEPTLYTRENFDRIIFDVEHEESGLKEVPANALFDSFNNDRMNEQELDKKEGINEERMYNHTEAHQDKYVQNDLPVPQFDDYSSDEDDYLQKDLSEPQNEDHISEEANEEEEPFYLRGRAAMGTEDYSNGTARAPHSKTNVSRSIVSFSSDDEVDEKSSTHMQSSEQEASLRHELSVEPLVVSNDKAKAFVAENSSAQYNVDEASQRSSFEDYAEPVSLVMQSSKISPKSISESSIMSPVAYNDGYAKPTTPPKLKWSASTSAEWELDPSYYKPASPSVMLPSLYENRSPSSQVNRKLNFFSGTSEDSESMSERSFDSHKLGWNLDDLNLDSPRPSFNMKDSTKTMDATQAPQPSPRKSFGVSKRSVRSTRSRQNQDVPSPTSGNEDITSPSR